MNNPLYHALHLYIVSFDTSATRLVARLPGWLRQPFVLLSLVTSPLAWAVVLVLAVLFLRPSDSLTAMQIIAVLPLATILKLFFRRSRPPTIYAGNMRLKSYSFPSSHAYGSALGSTYLVWLAMNSNLAAAAAAAVVLVSMVGISRVYLGAHYPSDVVAGCLLGAGFASLIVLTA